MKKLTLLLGVLMIAGASFAHDGKSCCKGHGAKCTKESACCKDKKNCKKECSKEEASSKKNNSKMDKTTPKA